MIRIKMPAGHNQLSLEGITYNPDAEGAFLVPDQYVAELKRVHGAEQAPAIQDLEANVEQLERAISNVSMQLDGLKEELEKRKEHLEAARAAQVAKLQAEAKETLARTPLVESSAGTGKKK